MRSCMGMTTQSINVRFPTDFVSSVDAIGRQARVNSGENVNRSDVIRLLAARGLGLAVLRSGSDRAIMEVIETGQAISE